MDLTTLLENTAQTIRAEAARDRQRGLRQAADLGDHHADLVERGIREWWTTPLTPDEAAAECAWSRETIAKRIGGPLPQAGERYKPRVRRCDLHAAISGNTAPEGPEVAGAVLREEV